MIFIARKKKFRKVSGIMLQVMKVNRNTGDLIWRELWDARNFCIPISPKYVGTQNIKGRYALRKVVDMRRMQTGQDVLISRSKKGGKNNA